MAYTGADLQAFKIGINGFPERKIFIRGMGQVNERIPYTHGSKGMKIFVYENEGIVRGLYKDVLIDKKYDCRGSRDGGGLLKFAFNLDRPIPKNLYVYETIVNEEDYILNALRGSFEVHDLDRFTVPEFLEKVREEIIKVGETHKMLQRLTEVLKH